MADETVKTLAVKIALEDGSFQSGIKNMRQQLSLADSEFAAAGGTVKGFGESLDGVQAHAQALSDKIKTQSGIVDAYRQKVAETQANLEKQAAAMLQNKQAMEQAQAAYRTNLETLGAQNKTTEASKKDLDDQTDAYKRSEAQVRNAQSSLNGYTIQLNKATGELKNMQTELANTSGFKVVGKNLQDAGEKIDAVGEKISGVGEKMTAGLTAPIATAAAAIAKLNIDYENGMAKISTIADTSEMSLSEMGQKLVQISNQTGVGLSDLQEAEYQAISSGVDTAKSISFMSEAAKAAKGGFTDTETAVDGLTTVLNAYNLNADSSAKISNQMMVAQNLGKTTFGEMAKSIGLVADTTANCNIQTQDLFSSLAVETAHGIDTSEAISGMREALSNVINPTKEAQDEAKKLGLQFDAAHLKSVGWAEFLKEIADKTQGNTTAMGQLFGSVQGLNTMITLTSKSGLSLFNESLGQMKSNTDYVDDAFNKVSSTDGAKLMNSLNALKNQAISFGDEVAPMITDITGGVKSLTAWIEKLTPEQREFYTHLAEMVAIAGPAVLATGKIVSGIGAITGGTGKAITTVGNFVKGLRGIGDVEEDAVPAAMKIGAAIGALDPPVAIAIAAFSALALGVTAWALANGSAKGPAVELISTIEKENKDWADLKAQQDQQGASDLAEIDHLQSLWSWLQKNVDANGKLTGSKQLAASIVDQINQTTGKQELTLVGDVVQGYKDQKKAIDDTIASKKAEILLEVEEPKYKQALTSYQTKQNEQAQLSIQIAKQQAVVQKLAQNNMSDTTKAGAAQAYQNRVQYDQAQDDLKKMQSAYSKNEGVLDDYYSTISDYESASAAETQKDYKKVEDTLGQAPLAYEAAKGATKKQLEEQVNDTATEAAQMKQRYQDGVKGVTQAMVQDAQDRASKAKVELQKFGIEAAQGAVDGVASAKSKFQSAGEDDGDAFVQGLASAYTKWQNSGSVFAGKQTVFNKVNNGWMQALGHNASGTDDWKGGLTWLNEQGGEIVNLPQHSQVIPHDVSMQMAASAGQSIAAITSTLSTGNASQWSGDFMAALATGIKKGMPTVEAATAAVANVVHAYLHFSVPDTGALSDADKYGLDFMQLLADTMDANSDKPATAAKKVAQLVSDQIASINADTTKTVNGLKSQLTQLSIAEKQALSGTSGAQHTAIETEYDQKKAAIQNEINLRKQQATSEIAQIKKIGSASKDELEQEIQDRKDFVSSVNSLDDEIKNALKAEYQEEEQAQEDAINKDLDSLDDWKSHAEDAINDEYSKKEQAVQDSADAAVAALQAESDALDAQQQAEDRAATHKDYEDKIADLANQITYSHDDFNRTQLQNQLAQEKADYQKELDDESVADQKDAIQKQITAIQTAADAQKQALENEKQAELDSITATYNAKKTALQNELTAVQNTYAQETTDAALEAQAEQMIVKGNQDEIIALLNSYGDTYQETGETLGDRLAEGMQPAINSIKTMISSITEAISTARDNAISALATAQAASATAASAKSSAAAGSSSSGASGVVVNVYPTKKETTAETMKAAKTVAAQIKFGM